MTNKWTLSRRVSLGLLGAGAVLAVAQFAPFAKAAEEARVMGVEAALWTEFIETERYIQFMSFPRLLPFAEVAWSPKGRRDEAEFSTRLAPHIEALRARGIHARRDEGDGYEFITN